MIPWKRINWTNTLFLIITPIVGVVGTVWLAVHGEMHSKTWILALIYTLATGLAITAGYHRLFSHRTYKTTWFFRIFWLLLGAVAFEGSAIEWSTDHRNHHLYVDTDRDPYNINQSFFHAHIGWLLTLDTSKRDFSNVEDLFADPLVKWQHHLFVPIAILLGFVVPMMIASRWGDMWGGLIIVGALRTAINHHLTFCINSVCHVFGKRTYTDQQTARDNWVTALFTYGEGMHNFHHQFPLDYRNGIRFFHFDPSKWLIKALSWFGLTYDLKRVTQARIMRFRLQMEQKRLLEQAKKKNPTESALENLKERVDAIRLKIMDILANIETLEKEFREKQSNAGKHLNDKGWLRTYRQHLKAARHDLASHMMMWRVLMKQSPAPSGYV